MDEVEDESGFPFGPSVSYFSTALPASFGGGVLIDGKCFTVIQQGGNQ